MGRAPTYIIPIPVFVTSTILPPPPKHHNSSKMFAKCAVLLACVAGYLALPQSPSDQSYQLPADGEGLLYSPLSLAFSCEAREYGYYADVDNNCQIFHICLPLEDDAGAIIETAQWSFICGNGTIFDQSTLTCNYEQDSVPCAEAPSLYTTVEFGVIPDY